MHGVNRAVGSSRRESGPGRRGGDTETALLALHVAAGLAVGHLDIDRSAIGQLRGARMLVDGDDAGEDHQQDEHGGKDGLALLGVLDADTEGEATAAGISSRLVISMMLVKALGSHTDGRSSRRRSRRRWCRTA